MNKKFSFTIYLFLWMLFAIFINGCTKHKADQIYPSGSPCDTTHVTFSETITPIIKQNCTLSGCHTNTSKAGGYSYETYEGFMEVVNAKRLLGAINHESGYVAMPKDAQKLSNCQISIITHWVKMGAPNN